MFSKVIQIEQILVSKRKSGIWIQCAETVGEERRIKSIKKPSQFLLRWLFCILILLLFYLNSAKLESFSVFYS